MVRPLVVVPRVKTPAVEAVYASIMPAATCLSSVNCPSCVVKVSPPQRVRYAEVNLDSLQDFKAGSEVTPETLKEAGLLKGKGLPIKIMGRGEVKVALKIKAHKVTEGARQKIEEAGGSIETIEIS